MKKIRVAVFNASGEVASTVLGEHVDVQVSPGSTVMPHAQSGKLRILAVAALTRQAMRSPTCRRGPSKV